MSTELNIEDPRTLQEYLRLSGRLHPDERPRIQLLSGGVSNRTVLVQRLPRHGESWVLKQALPKLRVEADWYCEPSRVRVEAQALRRFAQLLPAGCVPQLVFEDQQHDLLAMQAVGQPHENWKTRLLAGKIDHLAIDQFADLLGTIHRRAQEQACDLQREFGDRSYFEKLRLEPYYAYAAEQLPQAAAFLHELLEESRSLRVTLVHGDYSPKNVLIHDNRLVLLDYEVAHWGDPAFDLGFALTHLLSKAHFLHSRRREFATAAVRFWEGYCRAAGDLEEGLQQRAARHTLACLLARVAGRSPLEYLAEGHRRVQQSAVCQLLAAPPHAVSELVDRFLEHLEQ